MSEASTFTTSPTSPTTDSKGEGNNTLHCSPSGVPSAVNPVLSSSLAQNISAVPAVPFALQVPGIVPGGLPLAVNSQLGMPGTTHADRNMQALAQSLQAQSAGGIIVLSVGNGNNLAAALSQLGTLIQQPQAPVTIAQVPLPTTAVVATASVAQTVTSTAGCLVSSVSSSPASTSSPNTPSLSKMNSQQITPIISQRFIPPQSADYQNPVSIPPVPQAQQPAAFMLVPIPQLPAAQNAQTSVAYSHQSPAPMFLNLQNQAASSGAAYQPMQSHLQHVQITSQQQQFTPHPVDHITTSAALSMLSQVPKREELREFLMRNSASNLSAPPNDATLACATVVATPLSSQPLNSQSLCLPQNGIATMLKPPALSQLEQEPRSSAIGHSKVITTALVASPPSQAQPTVVSSPGLAFLAQVSSLTPREHTNSLAASKACTSISQSSSSLKDCFQNHIRHEVNNHLPVLKLDEVKHDLLINEDSSASSTTKLGEESLHGREPVIIREQPVLDTADVIVQELMEQQNSQYQAGERRRKEMPFPPPVREKKKKGPAPKLNGNEVCLICGDKASGFHYNTLSCEGCKGFFRRTVIKAAKYQCKLSGDCTMDLYMRRKCQKCRFEKCKAVGMREESVLSEEKVKAKKMKKEGDGTPSPTRYLLDDSSMPMLTPQQRSLIELLKANERRFQWPTIEDMKKVTVWVEGDDTPHSRALRFAHFTELCILIVQLVVEFTKQLPGFLTVLREDQIVLLKACAIEVMLLRAAKQYNKHDGSINFLNGKLYDKSSFYKAGMQVEFVDPIFKFCNSMAQLGLDETEYAILVAINTFSTDRPHIKDIEKVECMQDPYVELLRVYSRIRHPDDPLMFARILMKIVELRTLNNYHSEQIFALKVQDKKLPPLLAEIWDM